MRPCRTTEAAGNPGVSALKISTRLGAVAADAPPADTLKTPPSSAVASQYRPVILGIPKPVPKPSERCGLAITVEGEDSSVARAQKGDVSKDLRLILHLLQSTLKDTECVQQPVSS
jgi:hypothetical protein